jgi:hypothetical protein
MRLRSNNHSKQTIEISKFTGNGSIVSLPFQSWQLFLSCRSLYAAIELEEAAARSLIRIRSLRFVSFANALRHVERRISSLASD